MNFWLILNKWGHCGKIEDENDAITMNGKMDWLALFFENEYYDLSDLIMINAI